jgi:hypothetical protein
MSRKNKQLVLNRISKLKNSIRHKYNSFKQGTLESERIIEKQYKPLITQLRNIKPEIKEEFKQEPYFNPIVFSSPNKTVTDADTIYETSLQPKNLFMQQSFVAPLQNEETFGDSEEEAADVSSVLGTSEGIETASQYVKENFTNPLTSKFMLKLMRDVGGSKRVIDNTFGPRFEGNTLMIGDQPLQFNEDGSIAIANTTYKPTPGLYELIFKRLPNEEIYNTEDLSSYRDLILKTNAHKKSYKFINRINRDNSLKYRYVISKLFPKQLYGGRGLYSKVVSAPDLVYWDNPNELVERLKLLVASTEAGNTSHKNEIMNIIQELRESGYIKGRVKGSFKSLLQ